MIQARWAGTVRYSEFLRISNPLRGPLPPPQAATDRPRSAAVPGWAVFPQVAVSPQRPCSGGMSSAVGCADRDRGRLQRTFSSLARIDLNAGSRCVKSLPAPRRTWRSDCAKHVDSAIRSRLCRSPLSRTVRLRRPGFRLRAAALFSRCHAHAAGPAVGRGVGSGAGPPGVPGDVGRLRGRVPDRRLPVSVARPVRRRRSPVSRDARPARGSGIWPEFRNTGQIQYLLSVDTDLSSLLFGDLTMLTD